MLITEWELECALYSRFDLVLPDLHAQDYRMERQVLLSGISRRMDIVLTRPDHAWIIELKRGSPHVVNTTAQILDYQRCWKAAYPNVPVSLMVISTEASEKKIREFAEHQISFRALTASKVLEVLSADQSTELLGHCNRFATENEERIRFLLSNFAHTSVPDGMRFGAPWSHDSVFYALIRDKRKHKKPWLKNIYVTLFDQKQICAVLYHSDTIYTKNGAPLHINTQRKSWPANGWLLEELISRKAIKYFATDQKGPGRESNNYDHYKVMNWDTLSEVIGIKP